MEILSAHARYCTCSNIHITENLILSYTKQISTSLDVHLLKVSKLSLLTFSVAGIYLMGICGEPRKLHRS